MCDYCSTVLKTCSTGTLVLYIKCWSQRLVKAFLEGGYILFPVFPQDAQISSLPAMVGEKGVVVRQGERN